MENNKTIFIHDGSEYIKTGKIARRTKPLSYSNYEYLVEIQNIHTKRTTWVDEQELYEVIYE